MGLRRSRANRRKRGMAMLEMVFVLPVLLLIVFAIAEFGLMFQRWLTLSNAVREGARFAVVYRQNCATLTPSVAQQVQTKVVNYANAGGVPIGTGNVTVTGTCGAPNTNSNVSATFNHQFQVVPGLSNLAPTINIQYASQMRNE